MHTFDEISTEKTFQLKTMDFTRIPSTTWVCLLLVLNTWSYTYGSTSSTPTNTNSTTTQITEAATTTTTTPLDSSSTTVIPPTTTSPSTSRTITEAATTTTTTPLDSSSTTVIPPTTTSPSTSRTITEAATTTTTTPLDSSSTTVIPPTTTSPSISRTTAEATTTTTTPLDSSSTTVIPPTTTSPSTSRTSSTIASASNTADRPTSSGTPAPTASVSSTTIAPITTTNATDECDDPNKCGENAVCNNTVGNYTCTCMNGFTGNGTNCTDIDECKDTNICGANAECNNTVGNYTCTCRNGFTGNGTNCTVGNYTCTCRNGFTGNGTNCTDIDECKDNNICGANAECNNTVGNYTCTCMNGFTGNGTNCTDIDECKNKTLCDYPYYCVNTNGNHSCECRPGYYKDDHGNCKQARFSYVGYVTITQNNTNDTTELRKKLKNWLNNTVFKNLSGLAYIEILQIVPAGTNRRYRRDGPKAENITYIVYSNEERTRGYLQNLTEKYFSACGNPCSHDSLFVIGLGMEQDSVLCKIKGDCDPFSTECNAANGRYECTCKPGFDHSTNPFSDKFCIDIDECAHADPKCNTGGTCVNYPGTWACNCKNGFIENPSTKHCTDMCLSNPCKNGATCEPGDRSGLFYCKCTPDWKGPYCTEHNSEASTLRTILIAVGASLGSICFLLLIAICGVCRRKQYQKHQDRRPLSTQMNEFEMDDKKGHYQIPRPHVNNESERQYDVIESKSELNVLDEARSSKQDKMESRPLTELNNDTQEGVENRSFLHEEAARRNREKPGRNSIEYF